MVKLARPTGAGVAAAPFCNYLYTLCIILRLLVRTDRTAAQAPTKDASTPPCWHGCEGSLSAGLNKACTPALVLHLFCIRHPRQRALGL